MTNLSYSGPARLGAQHLMQNTHLGSTVELFADVTDDGHRLTITPHSPSHVYVRGGMELLYDLLVTLASCGQVNLGLLLHGGVVDAESVRAAVYAIGIAADEFTPVTPLRFGGDAA